MTAPLPSDAYTTLEDMTICRLLNGLWQVSGAHGPINANAAIAQMREYHEAGLTTWDLADHYGPAEDFIGSFRGRLSADELTDHLAFTKWVPRPGPMTRAVVAGAMDVSRERMRGETLDMLQFHWWDYNDTRYLDALDEMATLRDAGVIRHLALTNFDTPTLRKITEHGVRIVSNQVQYSIVDRRPEVAMAPYCTTQNIGLLTYGTLAGGLLTDRYLGQPEPSSSTLNTASLRKYKQMIDLWGGWALFQELLRVLRTIADRYEVSIANVAVRYVLDRPAVAGVIVGARLSVRQHIADNLRVFGFKLDAEDLAAIHAVTDKSRDLFARIGDTGDEYRRK
jgi:aryl-alcohol dehydrogenase-like predicted oxidoreductase